MPTVTKRLSKAQIDQESSCIVRQEWDQNWSAGLNVVSRLAWLDRWNLKSIIASLPPLTARLPNNRNIFKVQIQFRGTPTT